MIERTEQSTASSGVCPNQQNVLGRRKRRHSNSPSHSLFTKKRKTVDDDDRFYFSFNSFSLVNVVDVSERCNSPRPSLCPQKFVLKLCSDSRKITVKLRNNSQQSERVNAAQVTHCSRPNRQVTARGSSPSQSVPHHRPTEEERCSSRCHAQCIRRAAEKEKQKDHNIPLARRPYIEPIIHVVFGRMDVKCDACKAYHWLDERVKHSSGSHPVFSHCCHHNKIRLPPLPPPPRRLRKLLTSSSKHARQFRKHIRQYNSALAFTSFTAKQDDVNSTHRGPWVWKSGYTIYHRAGTLFPDSAASPKYAQLYFYDPDEALDHRMKRNKKLSRKTMAKLQSVLNRHNQYCKMFLHAFEILQSTPSTDLHIRILANPSADLRRYNLPTANELAVIVPGDDTRAVDPRDIILHRREGSLRFIHDHHQAYVPLHYVLLFPFGTSGWSYGMPHFQTSANQDKHITQIQYYSFRLHTRETEFPILQLGGRLFQQYVCDVWISTDQNRLRWVENNQPHLRAALYSGLEDAVGHGEADINLHDIGHRVVLPSSYIGGPRYMNQRFQDAIALARANHGFDLFVTFTCNAQWPEITNELLANQTVADRPDLIVRVFNMYKSALIEEISKHNIFGVTVGYVYTIEFQKRGLPHMHLLLSLSPADRLTESNQVDTVIKASWPNPEHNPHLFDIVKRYMIHGPCGSANPKAPCMKNGKCSKGFPKQFQEKTVMSKEGYPLYARPDNGQQYNVRGLTVDNRWIVPYNPYVLSRFALFSLFRFLFFLI